MFWAIDSWKTSEKRRASQDWHEKCPTGHETHRPPQLALQDAINRVSSVRISVAVAAGRSTLPFTRPIRIWPQWFSSLYGACKK